MCIYVCICRCDVAERQCLNDIRKQTRYIVFVRVFVGVRTAVHACMHAYTWIVILYVRASMFVCVFVYISGV